jgi:negative regulator of replication initiation
MKNFILAIAILFSFNAIGQSAKKNTTVNKPVTNTLYSPKEKEEIKKTFLKEIDQIGMSPVVKTKYLETINKYSEKLKAVNKDKSISNTELTTKANKLIKDQNQEIKKLLTPDQYKKHKIIYNRFQNSINYRIEKR